MKLSPRWNSLSVPGSFIGINVGNLPLYECQRWSRLAQVPPTHSTMSRLQSENSDLKVGLKVHPVFNINGIFLKLVYFCVKFRNLVEKSAIVLVKHFTTLLKSHALCV